MAVFGNDCMHWLALFLVSALLLTGCAEQVKTLSPEKLVPYTNAEHQFSISYPEGWSIQYDPDDTVAVQFDSYGELIQVTKPFPAGSIPLKEFAAAFVTAFKENVAKRNGGQVRIVFDGPTAVHGHSAHAIVFEEDGELGVKFKAVVIQSKKDPSKIYAVAVATLKNTFVRNSATYDAVIESFQEN